jgi:4-hydroxybenzoate polyprenyltransferase
LNDGPDDGVDPAPTGRPSRRLLWWYLGGLVLTIVAVALLSQWVAVQPAIAASWGGFIGIEVAERRRGRSTPSNGVSAWLAVSVAVGFVGLSVVLAFPFLDHDDEQPYVPWLGAALLLVAVAMVFGLVYGARRRRGKPSNTL